MWRDLRTQSTLTRYGPWLLLGIARPYSLTYFNYGIDLEDEGFLLLGATSILHGRWPMADFFSYQPLSYFFLAAVFKLFGNSVFTERFALMVLILVNVWMIAYCAAKLLPTAWAWMPGAVYAFAPAAWYKVFFITHLLFSLVAVLYRLERPGVARSLLLGFTAGLAAIGRVEAS